MVERLNLEGNIALYQQCLTRIYLTINILLYILNKIKHSEIIYQYNSHFYYILKFQLNIRFVQIRLNPRSIFIDPFPLLANQI
jgi:hypothetical protein